VSITNILNHGLDFFILGLVFWGIWMFRQPDRAKKGNLIAGTAMVLAAGIVLFRHPPQHPYILAGALLIGALIGVWVVTRISMLQIPSMVAFQNGAGGLASFLIAFVELMRGSLNFVNEISGLLGLAMGAFTFSGSMIAAGKLANRLSQPPVQLKRHTFILGINFLVVAGLIFFALSGTLSLILGVLIWVVIIIAAALFGILFAIRVGGADMPVLISFLNATTGLAAALCGMVLGNKLLISCGAAVAASGSILTHVMCKAMNRSLYRVFVPLVQKNETQDKKSELQPDLEEKQPSPEELDPLKEDEKTTLLPGDAKQTIETLFQEVSQGEAYNEASNFHEEHDVIQSAATALLAAENVIIITGYGMALAQAQFKVVELSQILQTMGKDVKFAIHPVAGRMPGHMNVLLAEAEVEYERLYEMDDINQDFQKTDVTIIFGACDVVNPAAINIEGTPISGMPILMAHNAKKVIVCNYDAKPGYSGVENPIYEDPKTLMAPGDAKETAVKLIKEIKNKT